MPEQERWSLLRSPRATLVATSILILLAPRLAAQSLDNFSEGARVRLTGPTIGTIVGQVRRSYTDGVELEVPGQAQIVSVSWSAVSAAQVSSRRRSYARVGAVVGLAIGTAVAAYTACCTEYEDPGAGTVFAIGFVVLGLPSAGVGALVGSHIRSDVWRDVPIATRPVTGIDWRLSRHVAIGFAADLLAASDGRRYPDIRVSARVTLGMGAR